MCTSPTHLRFLTQGQSGARGTAGGLTLEERALLWHRSRDCASRCCCLVFLGGPWRTDGAGPKQPGLMSLSAPRRAPPGPGGPD